MNILKNIVCVFAVYLLPSFAVLILTAGTFWLGYGIEKNLSAVESTHSSAASEHNTGKHSELASHNNVARQEWSSKEESLPADRRFWQCTIGAALCIPCGLVTLIGMFWLCVSAFRQSIAWGLACCLLPYLYFPGIFVVLHWRQAKTPYKLIVGGLCATAVVAGLTMGGIAQVPKADHQSLALLDSWLTDKNAQKVTVVYASGDIKAGAVIRKDALMTEQVAKENVPEGATERIEDAVGKIAREAIDCGNYIPAEALSVSRIHHHKHSGMHRENANKDMH